MDIGLLVSRVELRDWFIIVYTGLGALLFFIALFFTIVVGLLSTGTVLRTRRILKESIAPAMENVRETTENVRGTVAFVSDYAVNPVVKAYGAAAGARRFVAVIARVSRKR
jgi:hypothetical protein